MAAKAVTGMKEQGNHSSGEISQCTWCQDKGAKVLAKFTCLNCPANLCTSCKLHHDGVPLFKEHRVVDSKDAHQYKDLINTEFCKKHHGEKLEYFCEKCEQFLCFKCTVSVSSHAADLGQKHVCIDASTLAERDRVELNQNITRMEPLKVKLRKQIRAVEDELEHQTNFQTLNEQRVSNSTDTLVNEVKKKSKKLMTDIHGVFIPRKHALTEYLKLFRQQLEELCTQTDKYTVTWKPTNNVQLHRAMLEGKASLQMKVPDEVPSFNSITYDMDINMSSVLTVLFERFMGNVIEHVVLVLPPRLTHFSDVRHSEYTKSFFVSGHGDGLWKSDGERLRKVHNELSAGLCISEDGHWLYSVAEGNKVNVFELSPTKDPQLVRNIQVAGSPQSVCRAEDGRMAVICWSGKKIFVFNKEEQPRATIENIFSAGKPAYGAWIGGDALCVTVALGGEADKVMSIDTVRRCILWQITNVAGAWNVSYVNNFLYISHSPRTNMATVLTKNGHRIRVINCPTGYFGRMFVNINNGRTLTAVSYKDQ